MVIVKFLQNLRPEYITPPSLSRGFSFYKNILDIHSVVLAFVKTWDPLRKKQIEILTSMKGISVFTAITLISVVADIRRFVNSKKCASYLSRWLLQKDPTHEAVHYVNSQVDEYSEKERELQEKVWEIEDKISANELQNYNVSGICDPLKDFTVPFHGLDNSERKLLVESIVYKVVIGQNKKVTVVLRLPLEHLGFLSPSLAPREEKPKMDFNIHMEYDLMNYYRDVVGKSRIYSGFSQQEYLI